MIEVKGLRKFFKDKVAVEDVSFSVDCGEVLGLLGPNGAGKTTTIRILATVLKPDAGTAWIAGEDVCENPAAARKKIGVLTSEVGLYERLTAREILKYFGQLHGMNMSMINDRIEEMVELLDMGDFIDLRAGTFSTGMKRKVAIARTILHDPPVILFDEPTAGLDLMAALAIYRFVHRCREEGKAVIYSTHIMGEAARLSDHLAIIDNGRIVGRGELQVLEERLGVSGLEQVFLRLVGEDFETSNSNSLV